MIAYLIQVSLCWVVFYLVYFFFLRRETFFTINRYYLLGTLLLALFIPHIGMWLKSMTSTYPMDAGQVLYFISETPRYIDTAVQETGKIDWLRIIVVSIYLIGCMVAATRFGLGINKIFQWYRKGKKEKYGLYTLVQTDRAHLPFSFFSWIFLSKELPLPKRWDQIIRHEICHVRQWHSLDIILTEIVHIFFWFNPILVLYKKALRESHEYYADDFVTQSEGMSQYREMLLGASQSALEIRLANQFFNSELRNRISMLIQRKSHRSALTKYALFVPMLMLALFLFSNSAVKESNDPLKKEVKEAIIEAHSVVDLMDRARKIIIEYKEAENISASKINETLREVAAETGVFLEWIHDRNLNVSFKRELAKKIGTTAIIDKLDRMPPIYAKLEPTLKKMRGHFPLLNINGYLISGRWHAIDPDKIISQSYTPPDEAKIKYGDIAFGGVLNLQLSEFSAEDLQRTGVIIDSQGTEKVAKDSKRLDQLARFPGCEDIEGEEAQKCAMEEFNAYIAENLQYPEIAREAGVEGTVVIRFMVTKHGKIGNPQITRDIGAKCGDEAKYLIQNMNNLADAWQPAKLNGRAVDSYISMPIRFDLDGQFVKKPFSARHESLLDGEEEKPLPEVVENTLLAKQALTMLEDFEITPRPLFIVDGKIMEKDSISLSAEEVYQVRLLDESAAAEKYQAVNQKALEIITSKNSQKLPATPSEQAQNTESEDTKLDEELLPSPQYLSGDWLSYLTTFPNPAKFKLHLHFDAPPGEVRIRVHDVLGVLLYEKIIDDFSGQFRGVLESKKFVGTEAFLTIRQGEHLVSRAIIFAE